jgi:hypothetical protein
MYLDITISRKFETQVFGETSVWAKGSLETEVSAYDAKSAFADYFSVREGGLCIMSRDLNRRRYSNEANIINPLA